MASAFIILKDGRCFARNWKGYDEIIRLVIEELKSMENEKEFVEWLKLQIPSSEDDSKGDAGWGFYNSRIKDWKNRNLDLRSLTERNQKLFWEAIKRIMNKLITLGEQYSTLSVVYFNAFYTMCELADKGEPPMDFTDWNHIAEPCHEKNGPGWTN